MNRRKFVKSSIAVATINYLSGLSLFNSELVQAAESDIADGQAKHFDFDYLKQKAATLSSNPWGGPAGPLPATLSTLTPQAYNAIHYDQHSSLWHNQADRQLDVQFFHVGMGFKRRIRMYSVDAETREAREIYFRPSLFNYQGTPVEVAALKDQKDLGFAGFRLFKRPYLNSRDIVAFLGASYFRAVDDTYQYGLSARGLAINTFHNHEEFPDFTAFWFETIKDKPNSFILYALLDSESVTGAYKFTIDCQTKQVIMEVETSLYPRKEIAQLGIAPMTSMFSCGTNDRRMCNTYHPQTHDSDRLAIWTGAGEWLARPLNNPQKLSFNSFQDENPRGFGLLQLDHDFNSYQDVTVWYDKRPSLWVEPQGDWGKGTIQLMEIPTTGETLDNIVAFWQPAQPIKAHQAVTFNYKLYWSAVPPVQSSLARVLTTRTGIGGFLDGWSPGEHFPEVWCRRFAVDFTADGLKQLQAGAIEPVITLSAGVYKQQTVYYVSPTNSYRIIFDWYPNSDSLEPVEMRLFLRAGSQTLSETWIYKYCPPPPNERRYVDDRVMR
jgi:glucan biosynthesis protein